MLDLIKEIESTGFSCEAGKLENCRAWEILKKEITSICIENDRSANQIEKLKNELIAAQALVTCFKGTVSEAYEQFMEMHRTLKSVQDVPSNHDEIENAVEAERSRIVSAVDLFFTETGQAPEAFKECVLRGF